MAVELDDRMAGARRLRDKVCVVTGAGQGIGRATARRLCREGGTVVVADRIDATATEALAELRNHGVEAMKAIVDLGTFAGAQNLMSQTLEAYGRIDVLVNNVGGTIWMKPYHLYTEEEVVLEIERSLYPTLWCCLAVLPIMMAQKSGSIVNLGSQAIRGVNTVSPGGTDIADRVTPRLLIRPGFTAHEGAKAEAENYRREMMEDSQNQQALRRRGLPEEQAAAIAFLASDDSSFITGEVINCSGGQS